MCAISKDFPFVSLVTNQVSPEEVGLPNFDVLNCWLNLAASWLIFWSKISTKSPFLPFDCVDAVLDVIIQSWPFRRGGVSFTRSSCPVITSNISAGTGSSWSPVESLLVRYWGWTLLQYSVVSLELNS